MEARETLLNIERNQLMLKSDEVLQQLDRMQRARRNPKPHNSRVEILAMENRGQCKRNAFSPKVVSDIQERDRALILWTSTAGGPG